MDDWISLDQESDGNQFTPETCPHRVIFVGKMNGVPISPQAPKEAYEKFLQDAKNNAESFNRIEPGNFSYVGPGSEATWNFEKYADNPQGMSDKITRAVTVMCSTQGHLRDQRWSEFPREGRIEKRRRKYAFL